MSSWVLILLDYFKVVHKGVYPVNPHPNPLRLLPHFIHAYFNSLKVDTKSFITFIIVIMPLYKGNAILQLLGIGEGNC